MSPATLFDMETLRRGVEGRDAALLASLYSDGAELIEVDKDHPPNAPRRFVGRGPIEGHLLDICSREMTHELTQPVQDGNRLAFTETCRYDDGTNVLSITIADLDDEHKIMRQTSVTAWDG
jgi:hypothetical protein